MSQSKRTDNNRQIVLRSLGGAVRNSFRRTQDLRYHALRDLWSVTKRFGARHVENIEPREVPGIADAVIEGFIDDPNRAVLAALCQATGAQSFFEIGTNRGRTAWTVARNNPTLHVYTLDLPSADATPLLGLNESDRALLGDEWASGEAFQGTPEQENVTAFFGDSAAFDFSPFESRIDMVLVDGAHSYEYVRNDTQAALHMLSERGVIAWDDYPAIPGVYRALDELGPTLERPLYHIIGTRLVIYSRQDIVRRVSDYGHLGAA